MQRRWAAIYFAFFIVMSASGLAVIATASPPPIDVDGELRVQEQSSFSYDGQQYRVSEITEGTSGGGGHGGGGGASLSGTISYTDPEALQGETFEVGDLVEYEGGEYNVSVESDDDGRTLVLTESFDVEARLEADPAVFNGTVSSEGETFVRYRADDSLVALEEYLPEPDVDRVRTGETLRYSPEENVTVGANVTGITDDGATIAWRVSEEFELDLAEGTNVTMANGQTFLVHFPSDDRVLLTTQHEAYHAQVERQADYHERENGLWGVTYVSGLAAMLVLGLAYMPIRG